MSGPDAKGNGNTEKVVTEKSEVVRATFSGESYLKFQHLNGRLIFNQDLTARQEKEAVVNLAVECLSMVVAKLVKNGGPFVQADQVLAALEASLNPVPQETADVE